MKKTTTGIKIKFGNAGDPQFQTLLDRMRYRFPRGPVFTTDAEGLFNAYLKSFPAGQRQYHNCNECRHFMERFGGLVTIVDGKTVPALWHEDDADVMHEKAYAALIKIVSKAKVTGVFLSEDLVLEDTGGNPAWNHFKVPNPRPFKASSLKTADQAAAEKLEDFKNVTRALEEFSPEILDQAVSLLDTEALYRSEKVLGQAQWLQALHQTPRRNRKNYVWLAVATAPAGFCHPRSSMIGTLLEDLSAGMPFHEVQRRFAEKMHPLQYQRPTAAPKAGNVAQAEKIVEQLDAAGSLRRRFARLDEVEKLWEPIKNTPEYRGHGVFTHLLPNPEQYRGGTQTMTWTKFQRTVLPNAVRMDVVAPYRGNYSALVTAVNPYAPNILQWDNTFSWYVYNGGSAASQWGLGSNAWVPVNAIVDSPQNWNGGKAPHQGERVFFILNGARDNGTPTACLFPEILKSDFHGVRHVIEAYSNRARMEGLGQASACGLCLPNGSFNVRVRVIDRANVMSEYVLDRWE